MKALYFTPPTSSDLKRLEILFQDYTFDINFGSLIFEEQSDLIDALESDLQIILNAADISGYFEVI